MFVREREEKNVVAREIREGRGLSWQNGRLLLGKSFDYD